MFQIIDLYIVIASWWSEYGKLCQQTDIYQQPEKGKINLQISCSLSFYTIGCKFSILHMVSEMSKSTLIFTLHNRHL